MLKADWFILLFITDDPNFKKLHVWYEGVAELGPNLFQVKVTINLLCVLCPL